MRSIGFVDEDDLPDLYRGASIFAFPTLYEGFGLPILEAMACGTPVVTSNVASMPEVAGEAALLVDPHSPEQIALALGRLSADAELRGRLRQDGLRRAGEFRWETTARRTMDVYREVAA